MKKQRIRVYPNRIETYFEPPLQLFVLKETPPFHVMSAEFAGVLEGDRFETEIIVEPGAYVLLSTREASKLMSMPAQGARHDWRIVLRANAQLVSLPHEIIPFAQSDFTQSVVCEMKSSATFIWGEVAVADGDDPLVRTYRLSVDGRPAMVITECFLPSLDEITPGQ